MDEPFVSKNSSECTHLHEAIQYRKSGYKCVNNDAEFIFSLAWNAVIPFVLLWSFAKRDGVVWSRSVTGQHCFALVFFGCDNGSGIISFHSELICLCPAPEKYDLQRWWNAGSWLLFYLPVRDNQVYIQISSDERAHVYIQCGREGRKKRARRGIGPWKGRINVCRKYIWIWSISQGDLDASQMLLFSEVRGMMGHAVLAGCLQGWLATGPAGGWFHRPGREVLSVPSRLGLMGVHFKGTVYPRIKKSYFPSYI